MMPPSDDDRLRKDLDEFLPTAADERESAAWRHVFEAAQWSEVQEDSGLARKDSQSPA